MLLDLDSARDARTLYGDLDGDGDGDVDFAPIPEPESLAIMPAGACVGVSRRHAGGRP